MVAVLLHMILDSIDVGVALSMVLVYLAQYCTRQRTLLGVSLRCFQTPPTARPPAPTHRHRHSHCPPPRHHRQRPLRRRSRCRRQQEHHQQDRQPGCQHCYRQGYSGGTRTGKKQHEKFEQQMQKNPCCAVWYSADS